MNLNPVAAAVCRAIAEQVAVCEEQLAELGDLHLKRHWWNWRLASWQQTGAAYPHRTRAKKDLRSLCLLSFCRLRRLPRFPLESDPAFRFAFTLARRCRFQRGQQAGLIQMILAAARPRAPRTKHRTAAGPPVPSPAAWNPRPIPWAARTTVCPTAPAPQPRWRSPP